MCEVVQTDLLNAEVRDASETLFWTNRRVYISGWQGTLWGAFWTSKVSVFCASLTQPCCTTIK